MAVNGNEGGSKFPMSASITAGIGVAVVLGGMALLRPRERAAPPEHEIPRPERLPAGKQPGVSDIMKAMTQPVPGNALLNATPSSLGGQAPPPTSKWDGLWQRSGQLVPSFELKQNGPWLIGIYTPPAIRAQWPFKGGKVTDTEALFAVEDGSHRRYHIHMALQEADAAEVSMWMTPEDAVMMIQTGMAMARSYGERSMIRTNLTREAKQFETPQKVGVFYRTPTYDPKAPPGQGAHPGQSFADQHPAFPNPPGQMSGATTPDGAPSQIFPPLPVAPVPDRMGHWNPTGAPSGPTLTSPANDSVEDLRKKKLADMQKWERDNLGNMDWSNRNKGWK
jgi:hypothetical protein